MLQKRELFTLARELAHTKVLTAYVNQRVANPSERYAWRPALASALSATRRTIDDADERNAFDRASNLLTHALTSDSAATSHALFVTSERVHHDTLPPSKAETMVSWREGPAIAPYLRALEQQQIVIVASVHARAISLFHYGSGHLEALGEFGAATDQAPASKRTPSTRGRAMAAARNATATEITRRRELSAFQRLATAAAARLVSVADDDSLILVSGDSAWAKYFANALPETIAERAAFGEKVLTGRRDVLRAAKQAASTHLRVRERELATRTLAAMGGKAALGSNAVFDAVEFHAVDRLILSAHAIRTRWNDVEDLIASALAQGASVTTLSGEGAAALDRACGGIAARTRFAFESTTPSRAFMKSPVHERRQAIA
jgi:hypothetical protein